MAGIACAQTVTMEDANQRDWVSETERHSRVAERLRDHLPGRQPRCCQPLRPSHDHHGRLIERTLGETRRRVKVIGRLPGERSCLSLLWAVLDRASRDWRGVDMNPANVRHLQHIRRDLLEPHARDDPQPAPAEHDLPDAATPAA